jgi:hypothetical protein
LAAKFFTIEQANELLPDIEPLVAGLIKRRSKVIKGRRECRSMLDANNSDFGSPLASQMVNEFIAIERFLIEIRSHGCIIKNVNAGLVDFLSIRDGREVYLCWKYGEPNVGHYHELHTGFLGRQPI